MLGEQIKILRKSKGMSQEELANQLHVSRQTLSKWENGNSVPDAETLIRISQALDVTVNNLLDNTVEEETDTKQIGERLSAITEQLALRNRRSRLIWRIVGSILITIVLLTVLIMLMNYFPG